VSRAFLQRMLEGRPITGVQVGVADGEFSYQFD
jgi:hypothetical protein